MSSFDIITFSFVCVFKQARVKQHYFLTDLRWNRVGFFVLDDSEALRHLDN